MGATDVLDPGRRRRRRRDPRRSPTWAPTTRSSAAGVAALAAVGVEATRAGGTTVLVGAPPIDEKLELDPLVLFGISEKKLMGCFLGSCNSLRDIPRMIAMWRARPARPRGAGHRRTARSTRSTRPSPTSPPASASAPSSTCREHERAGPSGEDRTADGAGLTPSGPAYTANSTTTRKPSGLGASPDRRWPGRTPLVIMGGITTWEPASPRQPAVWSTRSEAGADGESPDGRGRRPRPTVPRRRRLGVPPPDPPGENRKGRRSATGGRRRRADAPGPRPRATPPGGAPRPTRGSAASSCATARSSARARPNRPAAPTPRSRPCAPPATGPAAPPSTPPSSRARTTAAPRRAPTRSLDAGVARVVVALADPDPLGRRAGHRALARRRRHRRRRRRRRRRRPAPSPPTSLHRRRGRAYAVVKTAMSLDGRTAAADGSSQWITGAAARADAHALRADSQAVVVGAGTALGRPPQPHRPRRRPRRWPANRCGCCSTPPAGSPPTARCSTPRSAPTLVVTTDAARRRRVDRRGGPPAPRC